PMAPPKQTRRQGDKETRRPGDPAVASAAVNVGSRNRQHSQPPKSTKPNRGNGSCLRVSVSPCLRVSVSPCLRVCGRGRRRSAANAGLSVNELNDDIKDETAMVRAN